MQHLSRRCEGDVGEADTNDNLNGAEGNDRVRPGEDDRLARVSGPGDLHRQQGQRGDGQRQRPVHAVERPDRGQRRRPGHPIVQRIVHAPAHLGADGDLQQRDDNGGGHDAGQDRPRSHGLALFDLNG